MAWMSVVYSVGAIATLGFLLGVADDKDWKSPTYTIELEWLWDGLSADEMERASGEVAKRNKATTGGRLNVGD